MSVVVVKFRNPLKRCAYAEEHFKHKRPPKLRDGLSRGALGGTPVAVYLPPEPAEPGRCSEPFVWQLADEEVIRLCGELPDWGRVTACVHEIDID